MWIAHDAHCAGRWLALRTLTQPTRPQRPILKVC